MTGATPADRTPKMSGQRLVWIGLVVVLAISAYVMVRMVQVSGPGPDPKDIPKRPSATADSP